MARVSFIRRFHTASSILGIVLPIVAVLSVTIIIILFGRGYRIDLRKSGLRSTGLLVASSDPNGAQVFVNGMLKTATNNTIGVEPDWYTVRISKEGYIPWEKRLRVQGEVVTNTDAFLFPSNPSLSPLTVSGVLTPKRSPDGTKLAYIVSPPETTQDGLSIEKSGLWLLDMADRPLAFTRDSRQIAHNTFLPSGTDLEIVWSPDSTQILVVSTTQALLFETSKQNALTNVTATLPQLQKDWNIQRDTRLQTQLALLPTELVTIATQSARIIEFAPDETKMLYEATASATLPPFIVPPLIGTNPTQEDRNISQGIFYVYDIKEDRNYRVLARSEIGEAQRTASSVQPLAETKRTFELQTFIDAFNQTNEPLSWFPTSRHLIVQLDNKIDIMEYDRINWITVYAGPHESDFVVPWPGSSRLVILTNLNPKASKLPNLYSVNLR